MMKRLPIRAGLALALAAALAAVVALAGLWLVGGEQAAFADTVTTIGIDMDATGNTATSLGTIDRCARIDAGHSRDIDVFLDGIPSGRNLSAYQYFLTYPTAGAPMEITATDQTQAGVVLIAAAAGSVPQALGDTGFDDDGTYAVGVVDVAAVEANPPYTEGVLARHTLRVKSGAVPGIYALGLNDIVAADNGATDIYDPPRDWGVGVDDDGDVTVDEDLILDGTYTPQYGLVAVGTDCPGVNLTISKTASPDEATAVASGDTIIYTLTATNEGTAAASDVLIRDEIGSGLSLDSVFPGSGVICTDTTEPEIECTAASIAPGQSRTVTMEVIVEATSGTVVNDAYVDPEDDIAETDEDDNHDSTSHSVAGLANLTITKTASPDEDTVVDTGDTITYTLTVSNSHAADATATSVPVRDTIGSGLSLSSVSPGTGVTCADTTEPEIECTIASIAPGQSRTVTIEVTVTATGGTVLNGAYVDPGDAIAETNDDADHPTLDCDDVGEGDDAGGATEPDNFDCTSHSLAAPEATATPAAGRLLPCPLSGKWALSVWDGADGTPIGDALFTCPLATTVKIDAAYWLDPVTNNWWHWFLDHPEISSLQTVDDLQAIITHGR